MGNDLLDQKGFINFHFNPSEDIEDEVTVDRLNALIDAINNNNLTAVVNGDLKSQKRGKTIICRLPSMGQVVISWSWKVKNTTSGGVPQVQVNGGDGFAPTLNGVVANVNGNPADTKTGSPAKYPQLIIPGNGVVYAKAITNNPGVSPVSVDNLDIYFAGSLPDIDDATPQTFAIIPLATISNYVGGGSPKFDVNNAFNYGPSSLLYCGAYLIWQ